MRLASYLPLDDVELRPGLPEELREVEELWEVVGQSLPGQPELRTSAPEDVLLLLPGKQLRAELAPLDGLQGAGSYQRAIAQTLYDRQD